MTWRVEYLPEVEKDLKDLDKSQRILVLKAIKKVQQDPLPTGYGKPLGNHNGSTLTTTVSFIRCPKRFSKGTSKIPLRKSSKFSIAIFQKISTGIVFRFLMSLLSPPITKNALSIVT